MTGRAQIAVFVLAGIVFLAIVVLVRRGKLKERFALLWLGIGFGVVVLAAVRPWLDALSEFLGIQSGTTTLFVASTLFLLGLVLHLSIAVSRLTEQVRDVAETLAILEAEQREG
ncbi:MAG: DUF2304 domain-containing protein [Acidimicrobiia bacterium]